MTDRDKFEQMCRYYLSLMEGDTHMIEDAYTLMKREGIVDEDGFQIYEEDEDAIQTLPGRPKIPAG
jgi:hypothetical protein